MTISLSDIPAAVADYIKSNVTVDVTEVKHGISSVLQPQREGQVRRRRHEQRRRPAHQHHLRAVDLARQRGQARLPRRDAHRRPRKGLDSDVRRHPERRGGDEDVPVPARQSSPSRRSIPARASPTRSCRSRPRRPSGTPRSSARSMPPSTRRACSPPTGELGRRSGRSRSADRRLRLAAERRTLVEALRSEEAPMSDTARLGGGRSPCPTRRPKRGATEAPCSQRRPRRSSHAPARRGEPAPPARSARRSLAAPGHGDPGRSRLRQVDPSRPSGAGQRRRAARHRRLAHLHARRRRRRRARARRCSTCSASAAAARPGRPDRRRRRGVLADRRVHRARRRPRGPSRLVGRRTDRSPRAPPPRQRASRARRSPRTAGAAVTAPSRRPARRDHAGRPAVHARTRPRPWRIGSGANRRRRSRWAAGPPSCGSRSR